MTILKLKSLIVLFSIGLLLASIGNGAVSYLKRVGLLERQAYVVYVANACGLPDGRSFGSAGECMCIPESIPGQTGGVPVDERQLPAPNYLFHSAGYERWLKFGKDALFGGFLLITAVLLTVRRATLPAMADSRPTWLLTGVVGIGFVVAMVAWGGTVAFLGLRTFEFLGLALFGAWAIGGMSSFAQSVGWLLIIEAVLVLVEAAIGLPLRACPFWFRAAGTMVLPNTLGIVAVTCLAFYASFSATKAYFPTLLVATIVLVVASGSGTGIVTLLALLCVLAMRRLRGSIRPIATVALLALCAAVIVGLPGLTHRPDIYDSLFAKGGRVGKFDAVLHASSTSEILIGRGLGVGTNAVANHLADPAALLPANLDPGVWGFFYTDSMMTVLLLQLGIIGIVAFYWLLAWAFLVDRAARPAYLVIALASLTLNITEVFPVNFLLGLLLMHSISVSGASRMQEQAR
jgi:hypothetical protein